MNLLIVTYAAAILGLALFGLHRLGLLILYLRVRGTDASFAGIAGNPPRVTIQLPLFNERFVARRVVMAAARMEYPRDRLQIQILDDSTDDTSQILTVLTRRLRRAGIDVQHIRRVDRVGFKAGALEAGLVQASGELVAVFDADFVPPPDFLIRSLGAFADPRVAMVQARWGHLNRESSLLTRLQAIFLDGHFLLEHVARHRSGRFFNFNGTAGIWRRTAIADGGGWQHDTLTEDLDLSYRVQLRGWRFEYVDELVSDAELPADINAFKAQQHRWAKGSVQTAKKLLPAILRSNFGWRVKLEAIFHLTNNLSYLLMIIPVMLWVPTMALRFDQESRLAILLAVAMAMTTLCVVVYHLIGQRAAGRGTLETIAELPALLALGIGLSVNNGRAVVEALLGHDSPFHRTPKWGDTPARSIRRYRLGAPWPTVIELLLALYFGAGTFIAIAAERWLALPFLALFFLGFAYVALSSLGLRVDTALRRGTQGAFLSLGVWALWIGRGVLFS